MRITLIGHSTVLIEIAGKKLLTDPYFGTWGNPAYKRVAPPGRPREACRDVDVVLVSHHHWDHIDSKFFRALPDNVAVLTPPNMAWLTRLYGARNVTGIKPWEVRHFDAVTITAVPAQHMAIAHGFVIAGEGRQVYFAGDTFYAPFMAEISRRFKLDVALMPVTTFRLPMTMNEKQAVRAVQTLAPQCVIPIHLDIQPRSPLLRTADAPEGFARRLREAGLQTDVVVLKNGESMKLEISNE